MIHMEEERLADLPEVTVDDLEDNLTQHVEMQQIQESSDATDEMMEDIRAGLAALFEDGWTTGEMAALTQDEQVRRDIAEGHGVLRAACAYLRRNLSVASGLPVGDFPQRRPDLLLKGRALHPQREVKRLPLPRKVFGKLLLCLPEQRRLLLGL